MEQLLASPALKWSPASILTKNRSAAGESEKCEMCPPKGTCEYPKKRAGERCEDGKKNYLADFVGRFVYQRSTSQG
jgi:hypothetical protein